MSDSALRALFYPFENGDLPWPAHGRKVLILNAGYVPAMDRLDKKALTVQQFNKSEYDRLAARGFQVTPEPPQQLFDLVLASIPKQEQESRAQIARALEYMADNGILVCAAANNAGGARLAKTLGAIADKRRLQKLSKHKCHIVVLAADALGQDDKTRAQWQMAGTMQKTAAGYWSQAGIYGWNKIDLGSRLLCENLPGDLQGTGADLGCGYGFLSVFLLQQNPAVKKLYCLDNDCRAVAACRRNIVDAGLSVSAECRWEDALQPEKPLSGLDWVAMNPPFHEGKATTIALGSAFIGAAAKMLRPGGKLWMVANSHLPYESRIERVFKSYKKIFEGQGFKIFCAER